jgi:hypothetical protein
VTVVAHPLRVEWYDREDAYNRDDDHDLNDRHAAPSPMFLCAVHHLFAIFCANTSAIERLSSRIPNDNLRIAVEVVPIYHCLKKRPRLCKKMHA